MGLGFIGQAPIKSTLACLNLGWMVQQLIETFTVVEAKPSYDAAK